MIAAPVTTPNDLTPAQKRGLELLIARGRLRRVAGGYGRGADKVRLETADALVARGLVRKDFHNGVSIVVTYSGKALHAVIAARQERRAGL